MGSPDYVAQRLWQAVDSLGKPEPAELRHQLAFALQQLVILDGDDFDDAGDQAAFETLMSRATAFCAVGADGKFVSLSEQSTIADSAQLLPAEELEGVLSELLRLHQKYPLPSE